jgi:hypothetical protein
MFSIHVEHGNRKTKRDAGNKTYVYTISSLKKVFRVSEFPYIPSSYLSSTIFFLFLSCFQSLFKVHRLSVTYDMLKMGWRFE